MSLQKRKTVAACALFIMLGLLSSGVSMLWESKEPTENEVENDKPVLSENTIEDTPKTEYTMKIQDGVLVVFSDADDIRPIIVTDIYAGTLRHFDRERLTEGITVSSEVEMQSLLEDFSS